MNIEWTDSRLADLGYHQPRDFIMNRNEVWFSYQDFGETKYGHAYWEDMFQVEDITKEQYRRTREKFFG